MPANKKDPCKANACKIQACLEANNFQESRCAEVLELMRLCCLKWHKESLCCSGISLDRSYLPTTTSNESDSRKS